MKKWLFSTLILSWQTVALAQQSTVNAPPAQHIFDEAFRHLNGLGRSYDKQKAVALFKEAAELGNGASLNALGNLHATGEAGLSKDIDAALDYYQKAGKAGYGRAYYNLATLYKNGGTVPQDFRKSAGYCEAGMELGDANCKKLLAYYYYKGFGVMQNYTQSFRLYQELAQTGLANAEYFTGLCYRNGYGTTANPNESKRWLKLAAEHGEAQAVHELTEEPLAENSNIHDPALQQRVQALRNYQEKLIAEGANDVSGAYSGVAVYYDFSGHFVHQVLPLTLVLRKSINGYEGAWTEDKSLAAEIKGSFNNNHFYFDAGSQYTRRNYYSYREAELYQFKEAKLSIKYIKDSMYLAGDVQFFSLSRNEPGQPMYILLSKKVEEGGKSPAGNLQLAISPNPAVTELKASFTLTTSSKVSFTITGVDGKPFMNQANEALLPPGTYSIPINVQRLTNGNYILKITTNTGAMQTKQFIKL